MTRAQTLAGATAGRRLIVQQTVVAEAEPGA
jgi:hypothetical protein